MSRRIEDYERLGAGDGADEDEGDDAPARRRDAETMTILLDDPRFVVVSKPSGMPSIPERFASRDAKVTAAEAAHALLRRSDPDAPVPLIVHRLDRDTSGALLLAKDQDAARDLMRAFEERRVSKSYLALTTGAPQPPQGDVTFWVEDHAKRPGAMQIARKDGAKGARECRSSYETLETFRGVAWVRVRPVTGRTHQVRLTLVHLGTPCAFDPVYGSTAPIKLSAWKRDYRVGKWTNESPLVDRLTLHAESISFPRPGAPSAPEGSTDLVTVSAPLSRDLAATLKQLRKWAAPGSL